MNLKTNEVFVFGSNERGFHGAGGAGLACRGDSENTWRDDEWFLRAMKSPVGSEERIGRWAVYGVGKGFQEGKEGKSYAICTVTRPGKIRSIPIKTIYEQLVELWKFADEHPELVFVISPIGEGYAGYHRWEMNETWKQVIEFHGLKPNIRFIRPPENLT